MDVVFMCVLFVVVCLIVFVLVGCKVGFDYCDLGVFIEEYWLYVNSEDVIDEYVNVVDWWY